jgi:rhodanese-related sulfurtransferase
VKAGIPRPVQTADLRQQMATGAVPLIIDVRTPDEFWTGYIPGSCNVPLELLRDDRILPYLDEPIVLVCQSGRLAVTAEASLATTGAPEARVLDGGITAWRESGAPVNTARTRWALERQVRLVAGSTVVLAVLASVVFPPAKWVAGLIGVVLTTAGLSNTCALGTLLSKLPYNRGPRTDLQEIVAALAVRRAFVVGAEAALRD